MRIALGLGLILSAPFLSAQGSLWAHVKPRNNEAFLSPVTLTAPQRDAISRVFKTTGQLHAWGCGDVEGGGEELLDTLRAEEILLSPKHEVLLVETGAGCARGAIANVAMWLIRFDQGRPVLLATPKDDFSGYLYSIQPESHFGYRDIVLAWHLGIRETDLSYFRFNGKVYECIGTASAIVDEHGGKIVPRSPSAAQTQR
jgi:hypothetical protein